MTGLLTGKRVLITQSTDWVGPVLVKAFTAEGAAVHADEGSLAPPDAINRFSPIGHIDILIAHLAIPAPQTRAAEVSDDEWRNVFAHLVDPLPRLIRHVLSGMIERRSGKIIVIGSAAAFRGMKRTSTYSAARGAQVSYVRAVGAEVAAHNVQVNLVAPNFIDTPTYFPPEVQALDAFKQRLKSEVPAGRMGTPEELASFVIFLASDKANFFAGQSFPISGGWVA